MFRFARILLALLAVLGAMAFFTAGLAQETGGGSGSSENGEAVIIDPALQATIEADAAYPSYASAENYLASITELSLTNEQYPVADLTALQLCTELQTITITSDRLKSLEPLTKCGKLSAVILVNCNVVDLEPLSRCGALQSLTIRGGNGWEFSPVASMETLAALTLSSLGKVDLTGVYKAPLLSTLALDSCNADYGKISSEAKMVALSLSNMDLTNAAALITSSARTLQSITIADSSANAEIGGAIGACFNLKDLTLQNVTGIGFPDGCMNDFLLSLTVDRCNMEGFSPLIVGASQSLTSVGITDCSLGSDVCGSLTVCRDLKELTLRNVTKLKFPFEGSNASLTSLVIEQTDLTNGAPLVKAASGALTSLTITDCSANAELGGAIGACGKLTELYLQNVEGLGFPDGCANKALATMVVSQCNMEGFSPLVVGASLSLISVRLTDCSLGQDVCGSLTVCGKMKELTLRNVTRLKYPFEGSTPKLTSLIIEQTDLTNAALLLKAAAKAVTSLTINDCYLGEEFCAVMGTCTKLDTLSLQNVTGLNIPDKYANKLLTTLNISQTGQDSHIAPLIVKLSKTLRSLSVADSVLDEEVCAAIGSCAKLKTLDLTNVTGLSFPEGCANKALATLTVDRCDMSGCAPLIAGASKILSSVTLSDSGVNEVVCAEIGTCAKLKTLAVTNVAGLRFPEKCASKALTTLTVDRCDMSACAPLIAGASKVLSSVVMTNSIVSEDVCAAIGACTKIKMFVAQDVQDLDISLILRLWASAKKS